MRFRGNVFTPMTQNNRSGTRITPETGKCHWAGDATTEPAPSNSVDSTFQAIHTLSVPACRTHKGPEHG